MDLGRLSLAWESPSQGSPSRNVENQEGVPGASTGEFHLALHPYPSSTPPVISNSMPVQKLASEARNTAMAPTSAGWPVRPRGWEETEIKKVKRSSHLTITPHFTWIWSLLLPVPLYPLGLRQWGQVLRLPAPPTAGFRCPLGRYWEKGGRIREVCCKNTSFQSSQFFQEALSPLGAAHQLTRTPY